MTASMHIATWVEALDICASGCSEPKRATEAGSLGSYLFVSGCMIFDASDSMLELRRRMTSSPTYERLTTEDEIDDVPYLNETNMNVTRAPKRSSKTCAKFCFFFALSGVLFLTTISHLLKTENLYVKVGAKGEAEKLEIADNVSEASVMYIGVMILAAFSYFSGRGAINNGQRLNH